MEDATNNQGTMTGRTMAEKAAAVAVAVNVLLTVLKFILAWWSKSLALKLEAFHSLADVGSSVLVLWAVRAEKNRGASPAPGGPGLGALAQQPERLIAGIIGLFLLLVGISFLPRVISPQPVAVSNPLPVGGAMLALALLSFLLARLERVVGEQERSSALVADSFHSRVDMFNSLVVAAALLGEALGLGLDRLAAGVLSVFIISQAVNVFGAVVQEFSRGDRQGDYLYREWLWISLEKRAGRVTPALVTLAVRLAGGDPRATRHRRRAGAGIIAAGGCVVLSAYLAGGFFKLEANEQAFVERLGRPLNLDRPLGPGLHWRWPWPFETTRVADVTRIRRLNVGSTVAPDRRTVLWTNQHYLEQFNLLSGENIFVDVGVVIHYRVADAGAWLYNIQNPEALLASITRSELTEAFSRLRFLDAITSGRDELEAGLTVGIRDALARYRAGIEIVSVQVRDAHPPTQVAPDFEMVVSASIEYETKINVARGYQNDLIPRARGEAAVRVAAAETERDAARNRASGDAQRYNLVQRASLAHPEVTRIRMRLETVESVLPGREKIIVPPAAANGAIELFMTADPGRPVRQ